MIAELFFPKKTPEYAKEKLLVSHLKSDKIMLKLLFVHWIIATFLTSLTYDSYLLGFIGGSIIIVISLTAYHFFKGSAYFRTIIAISLMLFSSIYIQQHLGRIEMHFHVFIAMAFLSIYRDILPVIVATVTTILYHFIFNYLQLNNVHFLDTPIMVFSYGCGIDIVLLHGAFAFFECLTLLYLIKHQIENFYNQVASETKAKDLLRDLEFKHVQMQQYAQQLNQFAQALDASAIVSKADLNGKITYANDKFITTSGFSRDELIGKQHNIVRHPDMPCELFSELWETITAKNIFHGIIKNKRKNGEAYYVDSTIIPILDIDDNITEYMAVRYDVIELINARDKAQESQKAKDRFLANMSHELRTPLNSILGFSQMLMKKNQDKSISNFLSIIHQSSKNLLHLINDILDLAKIQSGQFPLYPEPFVMREMLTNLLANFEAQADLKKITLSSQIDENIAGRYIGDWARISQIITNFLSNAIKFTPQNGHIEVKAKYKDGTFMISVHDTGIGLSNEAKQRIFNPFEQADGSTTREYGGTGLGLSISKELAHMMSGCIEVDSAEDVGSTFTLSVPIPSYVQNAQEAKDDITDDYTQHPLSGHILLAEDNMTNQLLVKTLLEDMGLSCDIAYDGSEAVRMYGENSYDLVLMDENMPNMSGIEAMQVIREKHQNIVPIIALTANVMQGDKQRFLDAGMDGYLGKPFDHFELYDILKKHLKT